MAELPPDDKPATPMSRTILAMVLSLGLYYAWMLWVGGNPPPAPDELPPEPTAAEAPATPAPTPTAASAGTTADAPVRKLPFEGCGLVGTVTTEHGGALRNVTLPAYEAPLDVTPIWSWALGGFGEWKPYGEDPGPLQLVHPAGAALTVGAGDLMAPGPRMEVVESARDRIVLRGVTDDGIEVTRSLGVREGSEPCVLDLEVSWTNRGPEAFTDPLWVGVHDVMTEDAGYYTNVPYPASIVEGADDYVMSREDMDEEPLLREGPVLFTGINDRYFAMGVLPEDRSAGRMAFTAVPDLGVYGSHWLDDDALEAGDRRTVTFAVYGGTKERGQLAAVADGLQELVDLGWFAVFAYPLLWLLKFWESVVGNWGLAILLMTVTVKALFFPLTQMSFKSTQRMQAIQPRLQEIREQFEDNPEELNRRTMELFRDEGVNPLGGCLPMLIQMPIWFALYRVLLSAPELYHSDFLYLRDISVLDPYGALPLTVVGLMFLQQQFTPMGNMDPTQQKVMRLMPIIIGFLFFTFPAGLSLYIFVNTVLTIAQQWVIRRQMKTQPAGTVNPQGAAK